MRDVLNKIAQHYSQSLQQFGAEAKGVGWGDTRKHALRFDKLLELVRDWSGPFSVNDLGCGYGALLEVLEQRGYVVSSYHGHEISPDMLQEAQKNLGGRDNVHFSAAPTLEADADFGFASGIFNVRFDIEEGLWRDFVLGTMDNMNAYCRRGFAFNILTSYVDWREDHLYYADPCFFFDYCKRHYSRRVALLHDTELYEWTMIVRKDDGA